MTMVGDPISTVIVGGVVVWCVAYIVYAVVAGLLWLLYGFDDWDEAKDWPRRALPVVLRLLARGLGRLLVLVVIGPAMLVAWTMVAFDPGSPYRARRNQVWQQRHVDQCDRLAARYRANATASRAAGYPLDAVVQDNAADLMRYLGDEFTADATPPESPPRIMALPETAEEAC